LLGLSFILGVKLLNLGNDALAMNAITASSEVNYTDIHLSGIHLSQGWANIFPAGSFRGPDYYTLFIRSFEAYKYPYDSVQLSENFKLIGFVDWDLHVHVFAHLKGTEGIV
jgi:hypothetical protein